MFSQTNLFISINSAVMACTILINVSAILVFAIHRSLLRIVSNRIILSLSVCDLCNGFLMAFHIFLATNPTYFAISSPKVRVLRIVTDMITVLFTNASVLHLLLIAFDRYMSLFYALRYKEIVTARKTKMGIAMLWFISLLTVLVQVIWLHPLLTFDVVENFSPTILLCENIFSIFTIIFFMLIMMIVLAALYIRMYVEIRRLLSHTPGSTFCSKRHSLSQYRAWKRFLAVFVAFALFSIPYYGIRFLLDLKGFGIDLFENKPTNRLVQDITFSVKNLPTVSNFLLYLLFNRDFRMAVLIIFSKVNSRVRHMLNKEQDIPMTTITFVRKITTATLTTNVFDDKF